MSEKPNLFLFFRASASICKILHCDIFRINKRSQKRSDDSFKHLNIGQFRTILESIIPNAGHRAGDGDARQAATARERILPDAGHRVGDGDTCQATTTIERRFSDVGHIVCNIIICDSFWNDNFVRILIRVTCYLSNVPFGN